MGESHDQGEQREQRLRALRDLANEQAGTGTMPQLAASDPSRGIVSARERGHRRRWRWLAGSLFVLVALVGGIAVKTHPSAANQVAPSPRPYLFAFGSHHVVGTLTCPQMVAWSPDSQRFAVVGALTCDQSNTTSGSGGVLAIFNAATHQQLANVDLDALIKQKGLPKSVTQNAQEVSGLVFFYSGLNWSPDGREIALAYAGGTQQPPQTPGDQGNIVGDPNVNGLLLLPTGATGSARFLMQPAPRLNPTNNALGPYALSAWNLTTGKEELLSMRPSLAYTWGADDSLQASQPLTSTTAPAPTVPTGPVGNPVGGTRFSLWQQASVGISDANCAESMGAASTPSTFPSYYDLSLNTGTGIWSPDGQVFMPYGLNVNGRLDAPVPPSALDVQGGCSSEGSPTQYPLLPMRDAGLRAALDHTTNADTSTLAWSADGARVAISYAQRPPMSAGQQTVVPYAVVEVVDCASGKVLATFDSRKMEPATPGVTDAQYMSLSWSPDGRHLLLLDQYSESVVQIDAPLLGK